MISRSLHFRLAGALQFALACVCLLLTTSSFAETGPVPTRREVLRASSDLIEVAQWANGFTLVVLQRPASSVAHAQLALVPGTMLEQPEAVGQLDLVLEVISGEGLKPAKTPGSRLTGAEQLIREGIEVSRESSTAVAKVSTTFLPSDLSLVISSLTRDWLQPPWSQVSVDSLVTKQSSQVARERASAGEQLNRAVYAAWRGDPAPGQALDHPLGAKGLSSSVLLSRLKQVHAQAFLPQHTFLVVAGPASMEEVLPLIPVGLTQERAEVAGYARPTVRSATNFQPTGLGTHSLCTVKEPSGIAQFIGVPVLMPSMATRKGVAARLALAIAGTGPQSRMNRDLRVQRGWAYGAGAPLQRDVEGALALARVQTSKVAAPLAATQLVLALQDWGSEPVSEAEFVRSKLFLIGNQLEQREHTVFAGILLLDFLSWGQSVQDYVSYVETLKDITLSEVLEYQAQAWAKVSQWTYFVAVPGALPVRCGLTVGESAPPK